MDSGNGSKRARVESSSQPSREQTPTMQQTPPRDNALEDLMDSLGIDAEFRASLRSMSPTTRNDVLNDIIRNKRMEQTQRVLMAFGDPMRHGVARAVLPGATVEPQSDDDGPGDGEAERVGTNDGVRFVYYADDGHAGGAVLGQNLAGEGVRNLLRDLFAVRVAAVQAAEDVDVLSELTEILTQRSMGITQDIDDMSYEQLLELQERIGFVSKGITAEQKQQCMEDVPLPREGSCVVCQVEWQESEGDERVVKLKGCSHEFHHECMDKWLNANKTCPVCKREVI